ncbi:MAG: hypothetical protein Q8Q09_06410 [Deltaproteobacteria bacterium]|nr:hypothetical protein [Deltaproteobacteria bacterium]
MSASVRAASAAETKIFQALADPRALRQAGLVQARGEGRCVVSRVAPCGQEEHCAQAPERADARR